MKFKTAFLYLWRNQRVALIAFGLALALMVFFAARLVLFTIYWSDPAHHDLAPQPWMTTGYVARSWGVDRDALAAALGYELSRRSLAQIAQERGQSLDAFLAEVAADAATLKARQEQRP